MVLPSQVSEVLLAGGVHHTHPVQDGLHHVCFYHAHFPSERGSLHMVQLALRRLKHAHAIRTRRSTSAILSALVLTRPPRYKI